MTPWWAQVVAVVSRRTPALQRGRARTFSSALRAAAVGRKKPPPRRVVISGVPSSAVLAVRRVITTNVAVPAEDASEAERTLTAYARRFATRPPRERFAARAWYPRRELAIVSRVAHAHQAMDALGAVSANSSADLVNAYVVAVVGDLGPAIALLLDRPAAIAADRAPDGLAAQAIDLARTVALDETADGLAATVFRALVFVRAQRLGHGIENDLDLALDLAQALDAARGLAASTSLDNALVRCLGLFAEAAADHDRELRSALDSAAEHPVVADVTAAAEVLERALAAMGLADLSDADMASVPLDGVRWSSLTKWPPGWYERVRGMSEQIGPDLFVVGPPRVDDRAGVPV